MSTDRVFDKTLKRPGGDPLVGTWLLDQYRIVGVLARGGIGRVYLAEQPTMDRYAAIKTLLRPVSDQQEWRMRFRQEARAASRLDHPNIVTVYNFGELADGLLFLAMEYIAGVTLDFELNRHRLDLTEAIDLACQCGEALAHAHGRSVVHRDFKPANVILTSASNHAVAKVVDFGVAKIDDSSLTQPGELLGTPRYFSPEECRGETATEHSDQYAFGLVLYEMLCGQSVYRATNSVEYIHLHQNVAPPLLANMPPTIHSNDINQLNRIVQRLLAKRASERFSHMADVVVALRDVAGSTRERSRPNKHTRRMRVTTPGAYLGHQHIDAAQREAAQNAVQLDGNALTQTWSDRFALPIPNESNKDEAIDRPRESPITPPQISVESGNENVFTLRVSHPSRQRSSEILHICLDPRDAARYLANQNNWRKPTNVIMGAPINSEILAAGGSWLNCDGLLLAECWGLSAAPQIAEISSSEDKARHIAALESDLKAARISTQRRHAATELADEMLLNVLAHASKHDDCSGRVSSHTSEKSSEIHAILRWAMSDDFIFVSVSDMIGSLTEGAIVDRLAHAGMSSPADVTQTLQQKSQHGLGMGIYLMFQTASHLIFAIDPGLSSEVVALISRKDHQDRKTIAIVRRDKKHSISLGRNLKAIVHDEQPVAEIALIGDIDETVDLAPLFEKSEPVVFDLSGIQRINSMGLRAWFQALSCRPKAMKLHYSRCSVAWVRQLNLMPALADTATIFSFIAPYVCDACGAEILKELTVTDEFDVNMLTSGHCPRCESQLSFDGLVDAYFAFLNQRDGKLAQR